MKKINKRNKGITLIALVVTIIILIILAGVSISMLSGDSGIIDKASEASTTIEIEAFKEKIGLVHMSLETSLIRKRTANSNYVATIQANFENLVQAVANELEVQAVKIEEISSETSVNTEGYTVAGYLDVPGEKGIKGEGYIVIWYTSNKLRSGIKPEDLARYGIQDILGSTSRNEAVLVAAIKVENYTSELSNIALSSTSTANADIGENKKFVTGSNKTSLGNDLNFASSEQKISAGKYAKVTSKYTDNNGETATIPAGFTVSKFAGENKISTGLVIYDIPENELNTIDWTEGNKVNIQEQYNQFVWVPCSGTSGIIYEKKNGLATTWRAKYSGKQSVYTSAFSGYQNTIWHDEGGDTASVDKYGGFFVARYEAGYPISTEIENGSTYIGNKDQASHIPVSKKNNICWNMVSQTTAKTVSENMYSSSSSVESFLIDSYAWDTIVEWMKTESGKSSIGINSINFGNYFNNYSLNGTDIIYAEHRFDEITGSGGYSTRWARAITYKRGNFTSGVISITTDADKEKYPSTIFYDMALRDGSSGQPYDSKHNYSIRKEVATGSLNTKVKNIYDMAGNMWEWSTEVRDRITTGNVKDVNDFSVSRGGHFNNSGSTYPVSARSGGDNSSATGVHIGFRTVLYIK